MTTFATGPMLAFDTETTGVNVEVDRIVSAATIPIHPGQPVDATSHLIAVDVDIPAAATAIHGITTEHARANGKPAADVLDMVATSIASALAAGIPVVACNAVFDLTILDRELRRNGLPTVERRLGGPIRPIIDVYVLDKAVDRYRRGSRKLTDLCAHYQVQIGGAHDSGQDALAAARVAWRIANTTSIGGMPLGELHEAQVRWYAEQSESLAQYWRRKANDEEHRAESESDEGARNTILIDVADLRRRADGVSPRWPVIPFDRS